jgi:hypothetical protein
MFTENLQKLFTRDLNKLKEEISLYKNENVLWITEKEISNSAGNLCLHLLGNLNAFIGAEIGKTGYVRNRPEEFSLKNIPKINLLQQIDDTIQMVNNSLNKLNVEDLNKDFPIQVFGEPITYELFLMHLSGHLTYHLGQINYHRRLLDV